MDQEKTFSECHRELLGNLSRLIVCEVGFFLFLFENHLSV